MRDTRRNSVMYLFAVLLIATHGRELKEGRLNLGLLCNQFPSLRISTGYDYANNNSKYLQQVFAVF